MCYDIPFVVGFCLSFCILFMSCISYHVTCALHLHTCSSHASEHFPHCLFCIPALLYPQASPFCLFSCAGVKNSRNGPRFSKRPWYTTGRPPVKFLVIWTSFDTLTVNQGTVRASCMLQPNTPAKWPKTHPNPFHLLERSIMIAWPKTAPHLDTPSSSYAYLKTPSEILLLLPPKS